MERPALALSLVLTLLATACSSAPADEEDDADTAEGAISSEKVNGRALSERELKWLRVLATEALPNLPGSADERLDRASRVAWWALKEAVWEQANVYAYSLCNSDAGDHKIGALEACGRGRAWQVGLAAVQVPGHSSQSLEKLAAELLPSRDPDDLLAEVAARAGFPRGSATSQAIIGSTGSVRASWLLRVPAIGARVVDDEVVPECINDNRSWCFGRGWDETRFFAPTRAAAMRSMRDLRGILERLSDGGPDPGADACTSATLGKKVPEKTCVQSRANRRWYRCDSAAWMRIPAPDDSCTAGTFPLSG